MNDTEKQLAARLGFMIERVGDEWHITVKGSKRRVLASIAEIKLWRELVSTTDRLKRISTVVREVTADDCPCKKCEALRKELL